MASSVDHVPLSATEAVLQEDPKAFERAEEKVVGLPDHKIASFEDPGDFLDPKHPQYGTVDEHGRPLPGWIDQITVRAIILAAGIGFVFNLMVLKLGFTVGIIPSLNIAAGLIGFCGIKGIVSFANLIGFKLWAKPFTRQENTVIQTTVVACYGLAFSGGFTNSLLAMDWNSYLQSEGATIEYPDGTVPESAFGHPPNPLPANVVQPTIGKLIAFMAIIYFIGVFVLVPLRKLFVIRFRLTFPSGTATGTIINGFHTPLGEAAAKIQIRKLGKWFSISFLYSALKWCFSGTGDSCGMDNLPSLGLTARTWTWYCDFSQTYIGIGLLVPKHITYGITSGAVLCYGIMWPLINNKGGDWFPEKYKQPSSNIRGIYGYKVFVGLGFVLGDGLYNICKLTFITVRDMYRRYKNRSVLPMNGEEIAVGEMTPEQLHERKLRDLRDFVFDKGQIPTKYAVAAYVVLAGICMGVAPQLFPGVKAYYVLVAYIIAPALGFCNAYGMGLSDWSLLTTYGKLCIVIFAAWGGADGGGIIAGLAVGTIIQTVVGMSADLNQDFKTGYLTLSSPRSMFCAQFIGAGLAVFISPATFWLYWSGFVVGDPKGEYKAPFAPVFRGIATVAVNGSKDLPKYCLAIAGGSFGSALLMDAARDILARKFGGNSNYVKLIPIPSMLGIPAFIGSYFTLDMTIGAVILAIWQYFAANDALVNAPVVASALIAGDGVWTVPSAILALAKVSPPLCAAFFKTSFYDSTIADLGAE